MKRKPIVGETLYSLNIGDDVNKWRPEKLTPVSVTNVGRKYFTCSNGNQYHLNTWGQKCGFLRTSAIYETEQEWLDEKEMKEISAFVRKTFDHWNPVKLPLETLRAIKALLPTK